MVRFLNTFLVLLVLTAIFGCSGKTEKDSQTESTAPAISDDQVAAVGKAIEVEYKKDPGEAFVQFVVADRIIDIIKKDPVTKNLSQKDVQDFEKAVTDPNFNNSIKQVMSEQLGKNSVLTYIGVKRKPDGVYAVMRLEPAGGGVNYWLVRCDEKKDLFFPISGTTANELVAKFVTDLMAAAPGFWERLAGKSNSELTKRMDIYRQISELIKSGKSDESIALYEKENCMSYNLLTFDFFYLQALQLNVTQNMAKDVKLLEKMEKVIASIKGYTPDFVGGDLFLIDVYAVNEKYEKVSQCIKNIKNIVGNDPYLDFLEGVVYIEKDQEKALELFKTAGKNGLQSKAYLQNYYILLDSMPNSSENEKQKLIETGVQLYGPSFTNDLNL